MPFRRTRSSSRRSRSSRPVRAREWEGWTTSTSGIAGEPGRLVLDPGEVFWGWAIDPNDLRDFYDEPTIVRSIIYTACHIVYEAGTIPNMNASVYMGLISWKNDNFPVTEGPQVDDATKDWIWYQQFMMFNGGVDTGLVQGGNTVNPGDLLDIRTKRKFQSGEGLLLAIQTPAINSGAVAVGLNARHLLLNG